jgi:DNA helicase II / ATP-dependent DNA helicase PcrA
MILSTMDLKSLDRLLHAARALDNWIQQLQVLKLPMLLEKIVYDCGIVQWLLRGPEPVWEMQVLQTLFDFVHSTCIPKPNMRPEEFLQVIDQMQSEQIALPVLRVVQQDKGIRFYTAHSAKGLEFEYVFLLGCTTDFWEDKRGNKGLKLPDTLTKTVDDTDSDYRVEVARRLFYVAMTRAKKYLYLSYAQQKNDGKPLQASVFIDEISRPEDRVHTGMPAAELLEDIARILQPVDTVYIALAERQLIAQQLEQYALSVSALNKYLRCPVQFYYEDILRTPVAENDSMAFGTAIHYALERTFLEMLRSPDKNFPPMEDTLSFFRYKMKDKELAFTKVQYERRMLQGIELLSGYYQANVDQWSKEVELEKWLQGMVGRVPVKGKIDKIEQLDAFHCRVVDYKTGNPDSNYARENLSAPSDKLPDGGDYWRQMVFYKLLVEQQSFNKLQVSEGVFEYIEKSKKSTSYGHKVIIVPEDERVVRAQIDRVYTHIRNMDFEKGCGKEDCSWCNFVRTNNLSPERPGEA